MALYDPAAHLPLTTRFGQDVKVAILAYGSVGLWMLGYPETALADAKQALEYARETNQSTTLMYALGITPLIHILNGDYATANALLDELASLVDEKKALHWKGQSMAVRGWLFCLGAAPRTQSQQSSPGSPNTVPREPTHFCQCCYRLWLVPMRKWASSRMLSAALTKR